MPYDTPTDPTDPYQQPVTREQERTMLEGTVAAAMRPLYRERAHLVAILAAAYPSVLMHGADPEYPDWPVVFVDLPADGVQVSWHIAPDDVDLFGHVPVGSTQWDGHDTDEKYRRIREATGRIADFLGHQQAL